jgi:hypothetical protein
MQFIFAIIYCSKVTTYYNKNVTHYLFIISADSLISFTGIQNKRG